MPGLIRRGDNWYMSVSIGGKERRFSLHTSNKIEARAKVREWENNHGIVSDATTITPTADVVQAYISHLRSSKSKCYSDDSVLVLRELFGEICPSLRADIDNLPAGPAKWARHVRLNRTKGEDKFYKVITQPIFEKITTREISDWLSAMVHHRKWKPYTATKKRQVISSFWNWALGAHGLRRTSGEDQVSPIKRVQTYSIPAPVISYLTQPQAEDQLRALAGHPQIQAMVATYIYAGLRLAEGLHLTLDDVKLFDPKENKGYGFIRVAAKDYVQGKWQPKTGRNRSVPISSRLYPYLSNYTPRLVPYGWYFPSTRGLLWAENCFGRRLRQLNLAAGPSWSALDFRHTFGSMLAMEGRSFPQIATFMGNSATVVERHYAHLCSQTMQHLIEYGKVTAGAV